MLGITKFEKNYFLSCLIFISDILVSYSTPHKLFENKHINKYTKYKIFSIFRLTFSLYLSKRKIFYNDRAQFINILSFMENFFKQLYLTQKGVRGVGVFHCIFMGFLFVCLFVAGGIIP